MEKLNNLIDAIDPSESLISLPLSPNFDFVASDADHLAPVSDEIHEKFKMADRPKCDEIHPNKAKEEEFCELTKTYEAETQHLKQLENLLATRKRIAELQTALRKMDVSSDVESKDALSVKDVEALVRSFSGDDNYPVLLWTRDFEDIMDVYKVSPMKRFVYAKRLLSGSAQMYMHNTGILNWKDMKQELIHTFGHRVTAWDIGKQLEARKIKKGESALQYFVAMCSIAMQAELATSDVIQFIVHGLQDKTGAAASMMYCTSLDELREKLLIYDQFRQVPGAVVNRAAGYEHTSPKTPVAQQSGEMRCFNCRKLGHRMSDCKQPKRPQGACFKCWGTDHQYRQCPQQTANGSAFLPLVEPMSGEKLDGCTTVPVTPLIDL
ncbi:hypothetical protein ACLKA6_011442 [Drosophila palustris]